MILIAIERPSNEVIINPKLALNKTPNQLAFNGNKCVKNRAPVTHFFFLPSFSPISHQLLSLPLNFHKKNLLTSVLVN